MPESGTGKGRLCRRIIEESGDGVIFADRDGRIGLWNRGAERIFGYPEVEAVGRSLDLIIPEKIRDRHWEGYRRVMATGETRYGADVLSVPALRRDGGRISIEFTVALVREGEGPVLGVAAIIRDVTGRREMERVQRERLRELETKATPCFQAQDKGTGGGGRNGSIP